ncbi:group 1 glycosyl transferase [Rivularia sp. IAM M-261]|nr:group 1 glycosyl transferase [Calothrix sp. PCC 7716]GJD23281.1 group 1 glycosyl transferase [Rivularia sp. IAM M-261]
MNLQGLDVLIDGYNLEMPSGTGIKTYTISLIQALKLLGANVSVLFSKSTTNNAVLDEVLFFENQEKISKLQLLKTTAKDILTFSKEARILNFTDKVIAPDTSLQKLLHSVQALSLNNCYTAAKIRYRLFGQTTTVKSPKKVNIWHKTYPLIPINIQGAGNDIVTIHDLVPLKLPYTTLDDKKLFYKSVKSVIKKSKTIITVSENSKRDILEFYDVDPDKIYVTYQAVNQNYLNASQDKLELFLKRYNLEPQKYILFVGAIEPKKNVSRLIDAYAAMDTDLQLVIVGKKAWLWEKEIKQIESAFGAEWTRKVKILDFVKNDSLKYLYQGAFCFVFPSIYEGFGLPPVEAMGFGCPVITSKTSCLSEVCGNAALYVDPYDADDIQKNIEKLVNQPQLRDQLISSGKERIKFFSLENYAQNLYQAYAKVI